MDPAPLPIAPDPFSARSTLSTSFGETVTYYRLDALSDQGLTDLDALPFTIRILLENVLRHAGGEFVDPEILNNPAIFPPDDVIASLEGAEDTSGNNQRIDIWEEFKGAIGG